MERGKKEPGIEWKRNVTEGIEATLESYELLGGVITFDPITIIEDDERVFDDLTDTEREWINREIFRTYSIRTGNLVYANEYEFNAPQNSPWKGTARVTIYQTPRGTLEDIYLHKIERPKVKKPEYMIAPLDFRL